MQRSLSPPRFFQALFACAILILGFATGANAQLTTGNVFGTVTDEAGDPLPGVTVTLSGVGAPRIFVTDADGQFRFVGLGIGTYTLTADLSGFAQATRQNLTVNIGRNTTVDIVLRPALEQTIVVTAETPLLDVRKTGTGATVTQIELDEVPTARDPWVIMAQVPGVLMDRINVGGNMSGQQSGFVSKGADSSTSTFNVDGVNITDMIAVGSSPTYYDFGAFEEIQVTTGGTDPRIQTPGAQLNVVTKRGTNEFAGSARYYTADGEWQSDPEIPAEAQSYLGAVNEIDQNTEWGLEIGGPVVRDRFWLWGSYGDQQIDLFVAQPVGQTVRFTDKTSLETMNFKANAQIASNNSAVANWWQNDKIKLGRNASPSRPPETTWN
ncbi:MAG: carboxypeptidase regulatory-like domain-containing protein, partial [Thermoanaerobaculia bacterium]